MLASLTSTVTVVGGGWRRYTMTVVTPAKMPPNIIFQLQIFNFNAPGTAINMAGLQFGTGRTPGAYVANAGLWSPTGGPLERTSISLRTRRTDVTNIGSPDSNVFPAPRNVVSRLGSGSSCDIQADPTQPTSPAGGIPMKMTVTGADPYTESWGSAQWNLADARAGETWTVKAWVRGSVPSYCGILLFGADAAGTYWFDDFADNGSNYFQVQQSSWTQVSYSYTFSQPYVEKIQIRVDGPEDGDLAYLGHIIWWDGIEVFRNNFNQRGFAGNREKLSNTALKSIKQGNNTLIQRGNLFPYS
jgi:hypothetical protein